MMNALHTRLVWLYLSWVLLLECCIPFVAAQGRGIPGSTQTESGYDTEMGVDPICWQSRSASKYQGQEYPFPNPLVANFSMAGNITLLQACPIGNSLQGFAPVQVEDIPGQSQFSRSRLRTGTWYNYTIRTTFNLTSLGHLYFVSDMGATVAFQVILCINGVAGFCSPFIHEEANERIIREGGEIEPVPTGNQHAKTHVHSPQVFVALDDLYENWPVYDLEVQVPMLVNDEADFYAIAAVQFFVGDAPGDISTRWDMANALQEGQRLLVYQHPAEVLDVTQAVLIFCHVVRAAVAAVIAFLLFQTIHHRNHQVLRLSQQPFLVVFLVAALVATVGSFLLEPRNDFYCRWSKLVVMSSLQLVLAVTAGRMWRINRLISPLLAKTLRKKESRWNKWIRRMCNTRNGSTPGKPVSWRQECKPRDLAAIICALTLPQILLQLAASIWQPDLLEIEFNNDQSVGRYYCTNDLDMGTSLVYYGYMVFVLLILLVMFMAQMTRHLPSLFNETEVIFDTGMSSLVVLILGAAVVLLTDDATTSPSIPYLAWSMQVFCITLNSTCRIMIPKLKMVWRGETVLVSRLVAEHAKSVKEDDDLYIAKTRGANGGIIHVTGLDTTRNGGTANHGEEPSYRRKLAKESDSQDLVRELEAFEANTSYSEVTAGNSDIVQETGDTTTMPSDKEALPRPTPETAEIADAAEPAQDDDSSEFVAMNNAAPGQSLALNKRGSERSDRRVAFKQKQSQRGGSTSLRNVHSGHGSHRSMPETLLIHHDQAPPKRLILKMYDLQAQLGDVNQRIMSGKSVPEAEWEKLRRISVRMGDIFEQVSFAWKPDEMSALLVANSQPLVEEEGQSVSENFPDEESGDGVESERREI